MISIIQSNFKKSPFESIRSLLTKEPEPFVLRQEVLIDFKTFATLMRLTELDIDDEAYIEIKTVFDDVKKYDKLDLYIHANALWDKLINLIDFKVTECNFRQFELNLSLERDAISKTVYNNIKKLYFLTDFYALNGRVAEAEASWKVLMDLLENEQNNFISIPLNKFDGAIPEFN
jgi:hypothetical protein